jgi:DNA-binding transcriptional LysR family regulator
MNFTLNQLEIFLKVAQTQSVTRASEALHLSQPAVSIQLKNFQDQFEIPLTEVVGRRIYITDFGREIASAAENILQQVAEINNKTQAYRGQLTGCLKLSVVSTGKYVMPYFLSDFLNEHQGVALEMDVTNKNSVLESLGNNTVDFALVSLPPANLNVEKIDLFPNKLYLIGKKAADFSKPISIDKAIQDHPLIFREIGSGTRQLMEQYIGRYQIPVLKKIELTSNEAVKQAVMAGLGYSIMPLIGIRNEFINKDVHIIPVKGLPIEHVWRLIWLKGKRHSPVSAAFIRFLEAEKERIVQEKFSWYERY